MATAKRQLPKAYLRLDPNVDQTHPDLDGLVRLMCAANRQPHRGRFKSRELLHTILSRPRIARFIERGDLVQVNGRWYLDGWDLWQEGDLTVAERQARIRDQRGSAAVTSPLLDRDSDVTELLPPPLLPPLLTPTSMSETLRRKDVETLDIRIGASSLGVGLPRTNGRSRQPTDEERVAELREALETTDDPDLRMGIEATIERLEAKS